MIAVSTDDARCREHQRFMRIDRAFATGDLAALQAEMTADDRFPDLIADLAFGACLPYAIYHSPIAFIGTLLDAGADPNFHDGDGFPPLLAALAAARTAPGAARKDVHQILELLLTRGADPGQRGINDYTALHWAAGEGDIRAIGILLAAGADPGSRTRIDDLETPADVARRAGYVDAAAMLDVAVNARRG